MAKKNETKKTEEKNVVNVSPEAKVVLDHLVVASEALGEAYIAADKAGAPDEITSRINTLSVALVKSSKNMAKRFAGLAGKADRVAARKERAEKAAATKVDRLEKMKKQQEALAARIAKMEG